MKRFILIAASVFFALQVSAQDDNYKQNNFSSYLDWAFYIGESEGEGADINYGSSHNFTYGIKYLRSFHSAVGVGMGIHYQYQAFHLAQNDTKLVPNPVTHDKEIMKIHNLGAELFLRFTLKRELSKPVFYIETGGYGNWAYGANHYMYDEETIGLPSAQSGTTTVILSDLNYIEPLNYGLSARLGYKMFAISASYRLSDYFTDDFKTDVADVAFPRITIGLQFNPMR